MGVYYIEYRLYSVYNTLYIYVYMQVEQSYLKLRILLIAFNGEFVERTQVVIQAMISVRPEREFWPEPELDCYNLAGT